ncbi:MAG: hypothetical protein HN568_04465 [Phycisphaerae bacterium]|nr:hypothetical protein [Phycisphaerae bacterium]
MFVSTLLSLSLLVMPSSFTIEKNKKTPIEVVQFNGVTIELKQELFQHVLVEDSVYLHNFPLGNESEVKLILTKFEAFTQGAEVVKASMNFEGKAVHRALPRPNISFFKGAIEGDPSSRVFLAVGEHTTNGIIESNGNTYVVAKNADAGWTTVYNLSNVDPDKMNWADFVCGVAETPQPRSAFKGRGQLRGAGCNALQVAIDTDHEFTSELFDGNTAASSEYAASLVAAMSTIFITNVDVQVHVSFLRLWESANDPWSAETTGEQLPQFREYWETEMEATPRHLAHLFSGRHLGGGIAYVGAVCSSYGYAVSGSLNGSFPLPLEDYSHNNWDIIVVAHETGHNCGTWHTHNYIPAIDNCGNDDCAGALGATIMSYCHLCSGGLSNIVLDFDPRVQTTIENYLGGEISCSLACDASLVGVCCIGESCNESTISECENTSGVFLGSGTSCETASCNPQVGACCTGVAGDCEELLISDCSNIGGIFIGYLTQCEDGYCDADAANACCIDEGCDDLTAEDCVSLGGTWAGIGSSCITGGCEPLENDFCDTAQEVTEGVWNFTTIGATTDDDLFDNETCPSEFLGGVNSDVWFTYNACEEGSLLVSTCGLVNFDTDIVVYEGTCTNMVQVDCNGDGDSCSGYTSELILNVYEGESYLIRVGGFSENSSGSGQLLISGLQCQPDVPCIGDVTGDGSVGVNDLLAIVNHWGEDALVYDVDESGSVDNPDLLLVISNWGSCQ